MTPLHQKSYGILLLGIASLATADTLPLLAQDPKIANTLEGHLGAVMSVTFSPDGQVLASGSADTTVKIWDVKTGKNTGTLGNRLKGDFLVRSVAYSPDGKFLASGGGGYGETIKLWDVATLKQGVNIDPRSGDVFTVAFTPDGSTLVSAANSSVKLWDLSFGTSLAQLEASRKEVAWGAALSPDGKAVVVAGSWNNTIRLWDVPSRKNIATLTKCHDWGVECVAFSCDGKTIASGGKRAQVKSPAPIPFSLLTSTLSQPVDDGSVKLWDLPSRKCTATLLGHAKEIRSVAFSPDGKTLASGSVDTTVRLWDVASGKNIATLKGHTADVRCVTFSPDGKLLATSSQDNTIKLWDLQPAKAK